MSYKLLLADDSITIQKVVGIIFANEDYELTVVDNGTLAIEKAREINPDIILIDALMPGKTGYEVCEEVRRDPSLKETPLLLLTGAFEPFDEEKAKSSGADDYISKPFESQHLIEKVKKLIELGKGRKKAQPAAAPSVAPAKPQVSPTPAAPPRPAAAATPPPPPAPAPSPKAAAAPEIVFEDSPGEADILPDDAFVVEEAEPEDDLWGALANDKGGEEAFSFDAPAEAPAAFASEPADPFVFEEEKGAADVFSSGGTVETSEEPFIFEDEPAKDDAAFFASGPQEFDFSEPAAAPEPVKPAAPAAAVFITPPPAFEAPAPDFAVEEEFVQVAPAPSAPPKGAGAQLSLSEDQLAAVISRVSKEIVEKIAWEVVPDLAESIIKEEIRKIKTGQ